MPRLMLIVWLKNKTKMSFTFVAKYIYTVAILMFI